MIKRSGPKMKETLSNVCVVLEEAGVDNENLQLPMSTIVIRPKCLIKYTPYLYDKGVLCVRLNISLS
jgi:hypothetical protein